jgi:putative transposase
MPRHARFVLAEVPVHVIQRGHNRAACFFEAADQVFYVEHLRRASPSASSARCTPIA